MILFWLALAFAAGVALGIWGIVGLPLALAVAAVTLGGAGLAHRPSLMRLAPVVGLALLGWWRGTVPPFVAGPGDLSYYNGRTIEVQGTIVAEPDVRDTGINYVVAVRQITLGTRARPVAGLLQLHLPLSQGFPYGESIDALGYMRAPGDRLLPEYRALLARRGIRSSMSFVRVRDIGPTGGGMAGFIVNLRQAIERGIDRWVPEPDASLLVAIALGSRTAALGDLAPPLVDTGLIHIIAISGIKVAMVAGTVYELARLTRRRLLTLLLALVSLAGYVTITGSTPSGVRSAIMWALVFLAAYLGRGTVALVSLAVAAAVMVGIQPDLLSDTGFQMSVTGTFAIICLTPLLIRRVQFVPFPIREALCVTLAAQVGTLPIVAIGFGQISTIGPVANAVVLPLLPVLIAAGFVLGAVASIAPLAAPLAGMTTALLDAVVAVSTLLARVPPVMVSAPVAAFAVAAYYLGLSVVTGWVVRRGGWAPKAHWAGRGRELLLASAGALALFTVSLWSARGSAPTRLSWLGTGEALLLTTPDRAVLIDGSPRPQTLLRRLGTAMNFRRRRLDLIVVTDPRAASVAGLRAVVARYDVGAVLDVGAEYPSGTYAAWRDDVRRHRIPVYALRTGVDTTFAGARITAIGPDALCPQPVDCAGMLRITVRRRVFLLAGAASALEQRESLFRGVPVRAGDVIATTLRPFDGRFLRRTGARRRYQFPGDIGGDSHVTVVGGG